MFSSIWLLHCTLLWAIIPGQWGHAKTKRVFCILQSFSITGNSPSDCLVSYLYTLWWSLCWPFFNFLSILLYGHPEQQNPQFCKFSFLADYYKVWSSGRVLLLSLLLLLFLATFHWRFVDNKPRLLTWNLLSILFDLNAVSRMLKSVWSWFSFDSKFYHHQPILWGQLQARHLHLVSQ